ncbi:unnamed protein product, partial [Vitis vinifera]
MISLHILLFFDKHATILKVFVKAHLGLLKTLGITKDYHTKELDICWVINNFNEGGINYLVVDSVLRSSTKPICSCIEINLDEKVAYIFHFLILSIASWCLCLISLTADTRAQAAMDRRQRRNPSASSSAFSSPASSSSRFRSEKFSSNPPKTSNSLEDAHQLKSKCGKPQRPKQEEEGEQDPNNLLSLVGTCPFMCPAGERAQRERLRDLAVFERLHGNPGKTSPSLAVKKGLCQTDFLVSLVENLFFPLPVIARCKPPCLLCFYLMKLYQETNTTTPCCHQRILQSLLQINLKANYHRLVIMSLKLDHQSTFYSLQKLFMFHNEKGKNKGKLA